MPAMINNLASVDWASLHHAYGPADEVPGWLRDMASPDPDTRRAAFSDFYNKALHQGSVYSSTRASLPFLFAMADDPVTPDRAAVVALLLNIGREALDLVASYGIICDASGDTTVYPDIVNLMRERADAFVAYTSDPDHQVRKAAIESLGLFLDDAERAVQLLKERFAAQSETVEQGIVVRTMADLVLRLPAAAPPARPWFDALADSNGTDPETRLAALVHRARCDPDAIDDRTVPIVIDLLRRITPVTRPEENQTPAGDSSPQPCTCEAEPDSDPGVPGHIAAAFDDLERHGRVHSPTTALLTALHEALDTRVDDREALLAEQLHSPDPGTRYDAIDMARHLVTSWRGDHTRLVRLIGACLRPEDSYTSAAAAEALGKLATLAEPAQEALAAYIDTHLTEHRPDAWASPHRSLRRAHQQAVVTLAGLGDERALPSLLVALDTNTDTWRAVNTAGKLPQAAAELTPRLTRRLAEADHSQKWPTVSPTALASALADLGDPAAMPFLADALQAAGRHKQQATIVATLKALASFGPHAASELGTIRPLTEADDTDVRVAAASAVWEIEHRPGSVVPLLDSFLGHRSFDAIDLAGRIGPAAAPVLPRLRQILSEQAERNTRNESNDAAILNMGNAWTLVHTAAAVWDIAGDDEADIVMPALLNAWQDNDSTTRDVLTCLDRMGEAARPALPRIHATLAQPRRGNNSWSNAVASDLEAERLCRSLAARLGDLPVPAPAEEQ